MTGSYDEDFTRYCSYTYTMLTLYILFLLIFGIMKFWKLWKLVDICVKFVSKDTGLFWDSLLLNSNLPYIVKCEQVTRVVWHELLMLAGSDIIQEMSRSEETKKAQSSLSLSNSVNNAVCCCYVKFYVVISALNSLIWLWTVWCWKLRDTPMPLGSCMVLCIFLEILLCVNTSLELFQITWLTDYQ